MNIVITGGAGFIGQRLARRLLALGNLPDRSGQIKPIRKLVLVDVVPAAAERGLDDSRVEQIIGDISDPALVARAIDHQTDAIFHLAAVVSGQAEADFELGMRINLDASRLLLERCRACANVPRVVFTSSIAVFGGDLPSVVRDDTAVNPQSSYGVQKAITELLVQDYSRKGFIDGRVLRLPTICVRPGKPNRAASSFASGIIREPLNGQPAVCPVSRDVKLWLLSPRRAIEGLIGGYTLSAEMLGKNRVINMPGISVTVGEMADALARVAGPEVAERIEWRPDAVIERMVASWPGAFDTQRAHGLGFEGDSGFGEIVRGYMEDELTRPDGT